MNVQDYNNRSFAHRFVGALCHLLNDLKVLFSKKKLFVFAWCRYDGPTLMHNNWGDDINVFFGESISGSKVVVKNLSLLYNNLPITSYSCIGSIIDSIQDNRTEVWGSGIINESKEITVIPRKIHSVRGPKTREELLKRNIECPALYGDPALLISRYMRPKFEKKFKWGIIPHYSEIDEPTIVSFCRNNPEVLLIKMQDYNDWRDIPSQICSCGCIISSSLHGLIMADSYRVPNAWVRFSNKIKDGDFKYLDYFLSVGRIETEPHYVKDLSDIENIIINNSFYIARNDKINYRGIFEACPFKERLIDFKNMIPKLPEYKSFAEKEEQFCNNEYVNSEEDLDKLIIRLQSFEQGFIFRGVSNAGYKMFASSQRHWMQKSDWVARMGHESYYSFVEEIIRRTEGLVEVQQYMQQHNVHTNDMFLMALMQHFEAPSPMIDFSENLLTGLFFASDWNDSKWVDSGNQEIEDYVSLYYISKEFDWVEANVQSVMQSAADSIERLATDAIAKGYTFDTKETEENICRLLYRQFRLDSHQSDITFIPLGGPSLGRVKIDIPSINVHCEYEIINDRIVKQQGMFIMNNTVDEPLVEVMNKQSKQKMFCCVNIHKKLLPYLREKYLIPNNLKHNVVYEVGERDVDDLMEAIQLLS